MDKIDDLRILIDKIDQKLMPLLEDRFSLSIKIGKEKSRAKTTVLDTKREDLILGKTSKYSHSPEIGIVYKTIMSESKTIQRK